MKRILLLLSVAILVVAMVAVTAVPAFATIHPLSRSEVSNAPSGTTAATQEPPGLSGGSNTDNFAQPVSSVLPAGSPCLTPEQTGEAQDICGTNPSPNGTAVNNAFEKPIA